MGPLAAGWYADPSYPGNGRWYDGTGWTNHVYIVPPPPPTAQQQHAAELRAEGKGPWLTVVGWVISFMGACFMLPAIGLTHSASTGDTFGLLVFLLIGGGLLTTGLFMVFAPDKIGAHLAVRTR